MKRFVILAALACLMGTARPVSLAAQRPAAPAPEIRLVLLIAVDQFRYDYLTRFEREYHDGFRRLLSGGAVFTSAQLEHYPTVTAVGHSTMLSGAIPADERNRRQRLVRPRLRRRR